MTTTDTCSVGLPCYTDFIQYSVAYALCGQQKKLKNIQNKLCLKLNLPIFMHSLHGGTNFIIIFLSSFSPYKPKQCTLLVGLTPALRRLALCATVIKVGVARRAGSLSLPAVLFHNAAGLFFFTGVLPVSVANCRAILRWCRPLGAARHNTKSNLFFSFIYITLHDLT